MRQVVMHGTNIDHGQQYNRRVVLEMVRQHGPLSRAEVARRTGLAPQTVSNIVDHLVEAGLIAQAARPARGRGQPPIDLSVNPDGAFVVGVSFDHRALSTVLVDLAGEVRGRTTTQLNDAPPDVVLPLIEADVRKLMFRAQVPSSRIWGVGVVMPAVFDDGKLLPLGPTVVSAWEEFPLREALRERLNMPLHIDNDATAAALGERLYGAGQHLSNFVYVFVGEGIGAGVIIDGRPLRGAHGNAGEVGHLIVHTDGRPCQCGNRGCLERYLSPASAQAAITNRSEGADPLDYALILRGLETGDPALTGWLDEAVSALRIAILTIENLFDPEAVVLGGSMPEPLIDAILARLPPLPRSLTSRRGERTARVLKSRVGADATALGAAALAVYDNVNPDVSLLFKRGGLTATG